MIMGRRVLPPNMRGVGDIRRAPMPPTPGYTPMPPTGDGKMQPMPPIQGGGVLGGPMPPTQMGGGVGVTAKPWDGYGSEGSGGFTGKAGSDAMTIEPDGMGNWSVDGGKMMPAGDAMTSAGGWMQGTPMPADANGGESGEMPAAKPMSTPVSAGQGGIQGPDAGSTYDMGQLGMMG